ncbi:MAG: HDOD domain-containing protein [Holosporales bacterium]|jgi:hypothetical protein|nr:HDOD domain-containing protein [Holosporales bacterium]
MSRDFDKLKRPNVPSTRAIERLSSIQNAARLNYSESFGMESLEKFLPRNWGNNLRYARTYNHSKTTAKAAKTISSRIRGMNSDQAYVYGLMHDVGKFYLTPQDSYKHPRLGYELLKENYYDIAEICISHAFPDFNSLDYILSYCRNDKTEANKVFETLKTVVRNDYIDLIQLCDKLSGLDGYTTIESKFKWYVETRGVKLNDVSRNYLKNLQAIKAKFDDLSGKEVYALLGLT